MPPGPPAAPIYGGAASSASASAGAGAGTGTSTGWSLMGRVKGWMMIGTVVLLSVAAYFIAAQLEPTLRENRVEIPTVTKLYFGAPWLVAVLSIPTLASCVPLVRGTKKPFLWMTVSSLLVVIPVVFMVWGAAAGLAGLYSGAFGR